MDRVMLLEELKAVTEDAVKDLIMPVKPQNEHEEQQYRAAEVYLMRLPDSGAAKKKVPYIIHQAITSKDSQPLEGRSPAQPWCAPSFPSIMPTSRRAASCCSI